MAQRPRPLAEWPTALARQVFGVFTDIDDTLTRDGAIEPIALQALHLLHGAGLPVIAITGRPMGWSLPFASAWPSTPSLPRTVRWRCFRTATACAPSTRRTRPRGRVTPGACMRSPPRCKPKYRRPTLAQDSAGRVTDIAIDHSEFAHLDAAAVARVVAVMQDKA